MSVYEIAVFLCVTIGAGAGVWAAPGPLPEDVVLRDLPLPPREDAFGRAHQLSIGSSRTSKGQFPFIVSVQVYRQHICGGSIITHHTVVTAAKCIRSPLIPYEVVAGDYDLKVFEGTEQRRSVIRYATHRNFTTSSSVGFSPSDISLLLLDVPFFFTDYVRPIKLPYPEIIPKGNATLCGWGATNALPGTKPDVLMALALPVLPYSVCLERMKKHIRGVNERNLPDTIMCAGPLEGGKGPCTGDWGGPLMQDGVLVGVASWGPFPCGLRQFPSGYTRVSAFTPWLVVADRLIRMKRRTVPALPPRRYLPGHHHHHHHLQLPIATPASSATAENGTGVGNLTEKISKTMNNS